MVDDLTHDLGEVLERADAGEDVTPEWLEQQYPRTHEKLNAALEMADRLARVSGLPAQVGPYRLLERLGAGGMGTVFRAEGAQGPVAVKLFHRHLLERSGALDRFLREAELGLRIRHPNLVPTIDAGVTADEGAYLVMEYVQGQTLRDLRQEMGRVPEKLCRHIARDVARALAAVHAAGIIHRDVKPDNVLITMDDQVRLMDLGVARVVEETTRLSRTDAFVGSLPYAAPEQLQGDTADARTDLYALGLTLFELASGRRLGEQRSLAAAAPHVSPFLCAVVGKLLALEPRARFADAAELVEVLESGEESSWWREQGQRATRLAIRFAERRETSLIGRRAELDGLRTCFERMREGTGQVVLLTGEAGIGKTRLIDEFLARLDTAGLHVLAGAYQPFGGEMMAGAVLSAFRDHFGVGRPLERSLQRYLGRNPHLVEAFAALLRGEKPATSAVRLDALRAAFVETVGGLASERPTVFVIEDLHFASADGCALLALLAAAVRNHRVLLVVSARPGLPAAWTSGIGGLPHSTNVSLARLGRGDVGALLAEALAPDRPADRLVQTIAERSAGNPLFVHAMLRDFRERGLLTKRDAAWDLETGEDPLPIPESVDDAIAANVEGLTEEERELLDVASCSGFRFDPTLVADALNVGRIPALRRFARLSGPLLRQTGGDFAFDHHLTQEALYRRLPKRLRAEYHAALADALEQRVSGEALGGSAAVEICRHAVEAGRAAQTRTYLDAALEHLETNHRNAAAARLAQRALEWKTLLAPLEQVRVSLRAAERFHIMGERDREESLLVAACRLADDIDDARLRARARRGLGKCYYITDRYDEGRRLTEEALAIARAVRDLRELAEASGQLGYLSDVQGRPAEAERHYRLQLRLARRSGESVGERSALALLGRLYCLRADWERAIEHLHAALDVSERTNDLPGQVQSLLILAQTETELGDFARAREHLQRCRALADQIGNRYASMMAVGSLSDLAMAEGRLREALAVTKRRLRVCSEIDNRVGVAGVLLDRGEYHSRCGDLERARSDFEEGLEIARALGHPAGTAIGHHGLGQVAFQHGELERAAELLARGQAATPYPDALLVTRGEVELARGRSSEARKLFEQVGSADPGASCVAGVHQALLGDRSTAEACDRFARNERLLRHTTRMRVNFLLWKASNDLARLAEAYRLLDELRGNAPERYRESITARVPLHRAIAEAWDGENLKRVGSSGD